MSAPEAGAKSSHDVDPNHTEIAVVGSAGPAKSASHEQSLSGYVTVIDSDGRKFITEDGSITLTLLSFDDASEIWNGVGENVVEVIDGRWVAESFPDCNAIQVAHAQVLSFAFIRGPGYAKGLSKTRHQDLAPQGTPPCSGTRPVST